MTSSKTHDPVGPTSLGRRMANKVPEVTIYFWIIKVLCTTVGETAADYLNMSLNLGLTGTSVATGILLVIALAVQFAAGRYVPSRYWLAVTLVSVFGTLVTDNMSDVGVPLETSTLVFGVLLAATFLAWYASERTLSIHSVLTRRREAFYWLAILFTFALGTATGDLMAEVLGLGYLLTGIIVASLIVAMAVGWRLGLNAVLAFWFIYILTRPLGASIGDYLSQSASEGGLGLGPTTTSLIFVAGIIGIVTYLSVTRADVIPTDTVARTERTQQGGMLQTVVVVALVLVAAATGYTLRKAALQDDSPSVASTVQRAPDRAAAGKAPAVAAPLGDVSGFRVITQDTLRLLGGGDQSGASARVADLETEWDDAQARLKPKNGAAWTAVDGRIDTVLRELRATSPNPTSEQAALKALLTALG